MGNWDYCAAFAGLNEYSCSQLFTLRRNHIVVNESLELDTALSPIRSDTAFSQSDMAAPSRQLVTNLKTLRTVYKNVSTGIN